MPTTKNQPTKKASTKPSSTSAGKPAKGQNSQEAKKSATAKSSNTKGAKGKKSTKQPDKPEREIRYPDIIVQVFDTDKPMTREQNRKLLGWAVPPEGTKTGIERIGTEKVWLLNNQSNRMFNLAWIDILKQEILSRKWRMNGEPVKVGKTGELIDGQHRCIAFELACQAWGANPADYQGYWDAEPTLETLIVFGIDEGDDTVNTIDFTRPRSLSDVIYRSEYFKGMERKERMKCARACSDAVKLLWYRTGASHLAFGKRTHSQAMDFITRHPKVLRAVEHIHAEDGSDRKVSKFISSGFAAGLLYLFGVSATERETDDGKGYSQVDVPTESMLDLSRWDKAEEFFVLLAQRAAPMNALIESLGREYEEDEESWAITERLALFIKAWLQFGSDKSITAKGIELTYEGDGEFRYLAETPTCGGIDLGDG